MEKDKLPEDKMNRVLQAMEQPEKVSEEELRAWTADEECMQACRESLDAKEALARRNAAAPDIEKEWRKFAARHPEASRSKEAPSPHRRMLRRAVFFVAAASVALFLYIKIPASSGYTVFKATPAKQEITIETKGKNRVLTVPRGMNRQITLADGTRAWLNAESQLEYPETFEGEDKRVVRLKGEAYFEVAKDASRPFIVETEWMETHVLGTAFNVRAYSPEDAHVTLVEGSVAVRNARHRKEIRMKPGQSATWQKGGTFSMNEVQAENYSTWTEGKFYFDQTELVEIMRELGRWYNVNIVFTNKEAMHYRLHFQSDRSEPLSQVLGLLNSMQKVKATIEKDKVIVGL